MEQVTLAMPITIGDGLAFGGRALSEAGFDLIRGITREFAQLAWTELAATICELLEGAVIGTSATCY
jgi:hypothetical protein